MAEFIYRMVDPRNDKDMIQYIGLEKTLSDFCNDVSTFDSERIKWARFHMGAIEYVDKFKDQPLQPLENNADEFAFVCEKDGEFIGYCDICTYHVVDGKRPNDNIGIIHDIFVKDEYRSGEVAYNLLQMAVDKLLASGKTHAICDVQEDNPNRFLHFAMAGKNVIEQKECTRRNGDKTISYTLLIDLDNLKNMTMRQLAKNSIAIKKEWVKNNTSNSIK